MWSTLGASSRNDASFVSTTTELVRSTTRQLILVIGVLYAVAHFGFTINVPAEQSWRIWPISLLLAGSFGWAWLVLDKHLLLAHAIWQGGLAVAISLGLFIGRQPEIAFFYALLPFIATVTVGWRAGLLAEALIVALTLWPFQIPVLRELSIVQQPGIAVGGVIAGAVGWAACRVLYTITQWSIYSFNQAQASLEEARRHRAQLARVVKDLDQAYYRLERANAALIAAWKTADEAERFKAEFVAYVSHELRTPLNLITGFSEMMCVAPESYGGVTLPGPYRSDADAIYRNARHLLALVDDVLDLARIDVGKLALARDRVDLAALIGETTDMVKDYVMAKGLELTIQVPQSLPELWLDRLRIRQVLLNLLVNAARFTERGRIVVEAETLDGEVAVRVTDTGMGIAVEDLPEIFREYRSSRPAISGWHSGTGLGLPISKKYVELHRGRIGVESTPGQGTRFWFTLPCGEPPVVSAPTPGARSRSQPLGRLGPAERIVVVVHDDPRVALLLQRHLDGYRVLGASNMADGRALADDLKAIALLTETSQAADLTGGDVPLIVCPLPSLREAAKTLGAQDLLVKPVSREDLLAALGRLNGPLRCVLIADDDPEMVRLLRRIVRNHDRTLRCLEARNGEEALSLLRAEHPDVVLLDLVMPGLSGQEVLRRMAEEPGLAKIPVIIVSARGHESLGSALADPIWISRARGFRLSEIVDCVQAVLNILAVGWGEDAAREPASPETLSVPLVLADMQMRPVSGPGAALSAQSRQ